MRIFVAVALVLMLVPVVAHAEVVLTYTGETLGTGAGVNGVWDYRYSVDSPTPWLLPSTFAAFGVVCPVAPIVGSIITPIGWTASPWSSSMNTTGNDTISEVNTRPGIMWTYDGGDYPDVPVVFGFQTDFPYSPVKQIVDGDSWDLKTEYSANPEPGSLLLLGIVMAGGKFWRRRRTSRK